MPALLVALFPLFGRILFKFVGLASFFISVFFSVFLGLWALGTDLGAWFMEQLLKLVNHILKAVNFDISLIDIGSAINALPSFAVDLLIYLGIGQCLKMLISAYMIRVTLNMIPFIRV